MAVRPIANYTKRLGLPRHWAKEEIQLVLTEVARCWESLERARGNRELEETPERLSLALVAANGAGA